MTMLLVDGNNLLMRALFATQRAGMQVNGVPTGPVHVFISSLARHVREEKPTRLLVAWDGGPSTYRMLLSADYKASRKPPPEDEQEIRDSSFDLAKRFLNLANVFNMRIPGQEADDLIAGVWHASPYKDVSKIVILSSDKDFLQLVGPNPDGLPTEQVRLSSSGTPTDRWTEQRVRDELGVEPRYLGLIAALAGDKVDGVRGVDGIGPKKAQKLLESQDWDLEAVMRLLPDHSDGILRDYQLVNLRDVKTSIQVPRWVPTQLGDQLFADLCVFLDAYKLNTIQDQLQSGGLWAEQPQAGRPFVARSESQP